MTVAVVLLATALLVVFALLTAASACALARVDGAIWPAALKRAAVTFAGVLTFAAAVTSVLATVCS
ncbi:hypothetical protein ACIPSA_50535 [Streptomyces sp. NPDC086549]|uniref:hypothetical protein n=1 Tax=Streptomyces sp. NPDC086549 TaxID=3365752 RepID=UPI00382D79B3